MSSASSGSSGRRYTRSPRMPRMGRAAISVAATQLMESRVADPEVVGDLVIDRVRDGRSQAFRRPVGPGQRPAEDRDLARDAGLVGAPRRPRHALVEAVQAVGADGCQLARRRLILEND